MEVCLCVCGGLGQAASDEKRTPSFVCVPRLRQHRGLQPDRRWEQTHDNKGSHCAVASKTEAEVGVRRLSNCFSAFMTTWSCRLVRGNKWPPLFSNRMCFFCFLGFAFHGMSTVCMCVCVCVLCYVCYQ